MDREARSRRHVGLGRLARDGLLVMAVLAIGLPFLVGAVGGEDLDERQEEAARRARLAAYGRQDLLSNSMAHKVVRLTEDSKGIRVRENYYTFFGLRWGWSEATVDAEGEVHEVQTGLDWVGIF